MKAAKDKGVEIRPKLCLADGLIQVLRTDCEAGFARRITEEVAKLEPDVDSVLFNLFSMATALSYVSAVSEVPVLSAPPLQCPRLQKTADLRRHCLTNLPFS